MSSKNPILRSGRKGSRLLTSILAGLLLLLPEAAIAGKFANQFTEFELPSGWYCGLEKVTWICRHMDENKARDAIIILAAKTRGSQDTMEQYQNRLTTSKTFVTADGKAISSESKFIKNVQINGHPWIDSLHFQSEVPGYMTRYFATIESGIGILITFTVQKEKYSEYVTDMGSLMTSLKAFKKKVGPSSISTSNAFQETQIPNRLESSTVFDTAPVPTAKPSQALPKKGQSTDSESDPTFLMILVALVGLVLYLRKKRQT